MKKLLIAIAIVLLASPCFAWTLSWDAATGADGYRVSYFPAGTTPPTTIDTTATSVDLDTLGLSTGVRYEFYVQGSKSGSLSGESDHIRWTYPIPPTTIEMMGQPVNIVINP